MKIKQTFLALSMAAMLQPSAEATGQEIEVIKQEQLLYLLNNCQDADMHLYNFWATWCGPCIEELPYLEEAGEKFSNVHVHLVSLDAVENLSTKLKAFISSKKLKSKVMLLDETDLNAFIDKVDERWSGTIPATVIVDCKTGNRLFFEHPFKEGELDKIITEIHSSP